MSMAKKIAAFGAVLLVAMVIAIGVVAYSFLKPVKAADGPIEAIPIASTAPTTTTSSVANGGTVATATSAIAATASVAPTSGAVTAATPTTSTSGTTVATPASGASTTTGTTTYTIVQSSSQARFVIDEVLNNAPKTVIGATDQVAGQIAVDPTAPTGAQLGTIQINARTLATDSTQRDNAIKNRILNTDANQYITFVPTSITGLPATATVGQAYTFQVVGQLTIAGTTQEATFAVTATPNADGTLSGTAQSTVKYADWGLNIPSVPQVASVADTLSLEIDFVAKAD